MTTVQEPTTTSPDHPPVPEDNPRGITFVEAPKWLNLDVIMDRDLRRSLPMLLAEVDELRPQLEALMRRCSEWTHTLQEGIEASGVDMIDDVDELIGEFTGRRALRQTLFAMADLCATAAGERAQYGDWATTAEGCTGVAVSPLP